ncbi:MAG: hypothetical protein UW37_C0041G0008 [Candidatus Gottesmanbacteria bacterium GW2011_GWA2_44_17]|uniref:PepSY domain-containing protein n=1 Tax=Candidatus Gottesmanbacteria bacterium GW2011_GWA2_44_17 TaxID=1618444 RepID=A0A0G1HGZ7_9BACT|nr:MAG: hypothetical protein UW37_C0041G0008 [Candidatus Gottesmanbacteria bacterium GW2011_GWA2_44_17]KKU13866.1 MAG: hypothetical protein UX21_C0034G0005 [Microgenomates group bacterium GW2011_GWC2_45_8]
MTKKTLSWLTIIIIVVLALAGTVKPANAGWYVNSLGWLVYEADSNVLGDEDEAKKEETKETRTENQEQNQEPKREVEYFDAARNAWVKAKTEIRSLTGAEEKTETEREKFKLKLKSETGILKLEAETEDGERTELGEDDAIEIEDRHDDKIRVATGSSDREMTFSRNRVRARTNFLLSVDLNTNELIVTTPNGVKRVTVLPDQAIANLLANDVIDRLEPENETELELTEEDGVPTYEVAGESDQKLLGLLSVKIKSRVKVSAETGEVVRTEKAILARLIDLFSF